MELFPLVLLSLPKHMDDLKHLKYRNLHPGVDVSALKDFDGVLQRFGRLSFMRVAYLIVMDLLIQKIDLFEVGQTLKLTFYDVIVTFVVCLWVE